MSNPPLLGLPLALPVRIFGTSVFNLKLLSHSPEYVPASLQTRRVLPRGNNRRVDGVVSRSKRPANERDTLNEAFHCLAESPMCKQPPNRWMLKK